MGDSDNVPAKDPGFHTTENIAKYDDAIWGWDTGAIFVNMHGKSWCLQDFPELMDPLLKTCDRFFQNYDPSRSQ